MNRLYKIRYFASGIFIIFVIAGLFYKDISEINSSTYQIAMQEARSSFNKDIVYRRWAALHGGVYVPLDSSTPPNPYLAHLKDRDVVTQSGKELTLMNPAYITRQVYELANKQFGAKGHITSLKPLRPENKPDTWEKNALERFEKGDIEVSEIVSKDNISYFRYMKRMMVEESCLKCHAVQGYKVGEIRGGISVSLLWENFDSLIQTKIKSQLLIYSIILAILLSILIITYYLNNKIKKKKKLAEDLLQLTQYSVDNANDSIFWIEENAKIVFVNNAACKILGYTRDELTKMNVFDIDPSFPKENWENHWQEILEKGSFMIRTKHKAKDGHIFSVEVKTNYIKFGDKTYNCAIARDITERKQAEYELKQSEARFRALVENAPDAIVVLDFEKGKFVNFNENACKLYGASKEELLQKGPIDFSPPFQTDGSSSDIRALEKLKLAIAGESPRFEWIHRNSQGIDIPCEINLTLLPSTKGIFVRGSILDITDRKRAEKLLIQKNKEIESQYEEYMQLNEVLLKTNYDLEIALQKAEESDQLKTAFLQNISHEIRTPLNGILGFSKLLQSNNNSNEDIEEYTGIINQSGNRLLEIVNNVLDISKIETGQVDIKNNSFSINSVITDLYSQYSKNAQDKNLIINYFYSLDNENSQIYSDESKINQIFSNLIKNAIKFTNSGSIDFGYKIQEGNLFCFVKDTGIGINANLQERIFERFTQAEDTIGRNFEGAGLGLAISKGLVDLLGGKIWFESELNIGTTFFFSLPYNTSGKAENQIEIKKDNDMNLNKGKILIVEDDFVSYKYLKSALRNSDCELILAKNGSEAVTIVSNNDDIDLILMDIRMPVMNGIDATIEIKKMKPDLPIIAQTAYAFSEEKEYILSIGCNEYLSKPVEYNKLMKLVNKYINKG